MSKKSYFVFGRAPVTFSIQLSICLSVHLSHTISQEAYIIWSYFLVHMCKMMIPSGVFLIFFLISVFWAVRGITGQKTAQNEK